jgi:hypothetical protein
MSHTGYFIDWNGQVRSTDDPGHGYCCEVDKIARSVTVISKRGATVHEAKLYRSLAAIAQSGVCTEYVSGSYPFLHRDISHARASMPPRPQALLSQGTRPRARQWFHDLRDRCTTSVRHVYALFMPSTATQSARMMQRRSSGLLDELSQIVKDDPHESANAPDLNGATPRLSDPNFFLD